MTNRHANSASPFAKGYSYQTPRNPQGSFYRARTLECLAQEKKAKRVHFYRDGDRFHGGVTYVISNMRFRTLDALLTDLTRTLSDKSNLPFGVRSIFALRSWSKIEDLEEIKNGESYVCSSSDSCKKMDYLQNATPNWSKNKQGGFKSQSLTRLTSSRLSFSESSRLSSERRSFKTNRDFIRPKLITVIRSGVKPRRVIRLLLNKKTAHSLEQVASDITSAIRLDTGAVRKIYTLTGKEVRELKDFFGTEEVFIACGSEKLSLADFEINGSEQRMLQSCETPQARRRSLRLKFENKMSEPSGLQSKSSPTNSCKRKKNAPAIQKRYPASLLEKYDVLSSIGDGKYSTVKKCRDRSTGQYHALKIIEISKVENKDFKMEDELAHHALKMMEKSKLEDCRIKDEVTILKRMDHPNIIQVIQDYSSDIGMYLLMELAHGDLFDLVSSGKNFSERETGAMVHNIVSALVYLHKQNIVHRDVKPENLLVFVNEDGTKTLKLGDFGLATILKGPLFTICGTPTYVAPEIILQTGYGLEVDVWAAGVIMYILLFGSPPFISQSNNQEEIFDLIISCQLKIPCSSDVSQTACQLLHGMLNHDKIQRMTALQVLGHSFLSEGTLQ